MTIKKTWAAWALTLALTLLIAANAPAQTREIRVGGTGRTTALTVAVGKSQDVHTEKGFVDVIVSDPDIADVNPLTDQSLSILGKKIGTTRVSVYAENKKLVGIFDIEVTYDVTRLTNELNRRFPGSRLRVSPVNGRIMLSGEVTDAPTLDQAVTIARQFGPEIINAVSVASPQQVMLEVRFIEISRNAGRELGVQWNRFGEQSITNVGNRTNGLPVLATTEQAAGLISGAAPFGFILGRIVANGSTTDVMLQALEQRGIARSLAEPNLVALSGDTASFLAGGEYPIPIAGTFGQITVAYKKYGVGLAFTPTVLSRGLINLKIEPEVSQIDTNHTIQVVNGVSVPALTVRRAATTVELRDGQSFAIGGLLQTVNQNQVEQLPWLGTVPVLGTLFSSKSYQKNQTDLVIIVTPRLVRPGRPGDNIKSPAEDTAPPNDVDFFLMGKTEIAPSEARIGGAQQSHFAKAESRPFTGHMLDLPKGGISDGAIQ
ncbi:type II and III secretion system protein family protein [Pseudolabrys taiwanensis]|uniref:type II and III secretion system protein family protein n=1 Tax=Pseudolabrys taiwanensis TaxID=331696 RepID=UPI0013B41566|nr:type II and III secretion system protein family protein [Pseudolabrys taiwanensis]